MPLSSNIIYGDRLRPVVALNKSKVPFSPDLEQWRATVVLYSTKKLPTELDKDFIEKSFHRDIKKALYRDLCIDLVELRHELLQAGTISEKLNNIIKDLS
jgi:hypothetical protein